MLKTIFPIRRGTQKDDRNDYELGFAAGYHQAEQEFCDTIVFQDSYISALRRQIEDLRQKVKEQSDHDSEG